MKRIYYIGGSPCSGKTTAAKRLAKTFDMDYFPVDEFLGAYTIKGALDKKPYCLAASNRSTDESWLRDPVVLNQEEGCFYTEIFPYLLKDIQEIKSDKDLLIEGAALRPELVHSIQTAYNRYLCMIPAPAFQYEEYRKRTWVPMILHDCSEPDLAFHNWMERDVLYAKEVAKTSVCLGYPAIIVDGRKSKDEIFHEIVQHFGLTKKSQDKLPE